MITFIVTKQKSTVVLAILVLAVANVHVTGHCLVTALQKV